MSTILEAKASANLNLVINNQYSPLLIAIKTGHMSTVELLIQSKADVNQVCFAGRKPQTALTSAIDMQGGTKVRISTIGVLLNHGASINIPKERSPLVCASLYNELELVQLLLSMNANVGLEKSLLIAAGAGHSQVAGALIQAGACVNDVNDYKGPCHVLTLAAEQGHLYVAQSLLDAKADVSLAPAALLQAATEGHMALVELLLDSKILPDQSVGDRPTPLHAAAARGHLNVAKALIAAKADVDFEKNGLTALYLAADASQESMVNLLLNSDVNVNLIPRKDNDFSPLYSACKNGDKHIVDRLLGAGAGVKGVTYGEIPLHAACRRGHAEIVSALLHADDSQPHVLHLTSDGIPVK